MCMDKRCVCIIYTHFSGGYGTLFPISRSLREGCLLAPFHFIVFGEALSSFLRSSIVAIQAIVLTIVNLTVLDADFADDTNLYIHGDVSNLDRVPNALQTFSDAIGASLNWNKFVGLWVSDVSRPTWYPGLESHWLNNGEHIRYLGCLVGIDLSSEAMLSPLLLSIKRKLV